MFPLEVFVFHKHSDQEKRMISNARALGASFKFSLPSDFSRDDPLISRALGKGSTIRRSGGFWRVRSLAKGTFLFQATFARCTSRKEFAWDPDSATYERFFAMGPNLAALVYSHKIDQENPFYYLRVFKTTKPLLLLTDDSDLVDECAWQMAHKKKRRRLIHQSIVVEQEQEYPTYAECLAMALRPKTRAFDSLRAEIKDKREEKEGDFEEKLKTPEFLFKFSSHPDIYEVGKEEEIWFDFAEALGLDGFVFSDYDTLEKDQVRVSVQGEFSQSSGSIYKMWEVGLVNPSSVLEYLDCVIMRSYTTDPYSRVLVRPTSQDAMESLLKNKLFLQELKNCLETFNQEECKHMSATSRIASEDYSLETLQDYFESDYPKHRIEAMDAWLHERVYKPMRESMKMYTL